jgi:hypothetical protein
MRNLNGRNFEAGLCVTFEFTPEEADRFLAAKTEDRGRALDEILSHKSPLPESSSYNAESFFKKVGEYLAQMRERELRQLPEGAPGAQEGEAV